jgi:hypothetical protein
MNHRVFFQTPPWSCIVCLVSSVRALGESGTAQNGVEKTSYWRANQKKKNEHNSPCEFRKYFCDGQMKKEKEKKLVIG